MAVKLSERLELFKFDRPSEYLMKEFIQQAKDLEAEVLHENELFIEWRARAEGLQTQLEAVKERMRFYTHGMYRMIMNEDYSDQGQ